MKHVYFIVVVIFMLSCDTTRKQDLKAPNIILIVADDLGWNDVGFHGSDIKTPNLDRLRAESIELKRFYSAPVCSPTRAGLLTGMYPDRFNLRNYVFSPQHKGGIPPEEQFLPEMLKKAGYKERAAFGKWHLGHSEYKYHPNNQGFTSFYGHYNGAIDYFSHKRDAELDWHRNNQPSYDKGYSTDLIEKEVVKFIKQSDEESPFFAYVAFNAPHSPMQAKKEHLKMYGYDSLLDTEDYPVGGSRDGEREMESYGMKGRGNSLRQTFAAMVSAMDESIGSILEGVKEKGIENNTLIWFLSDNGGSYVFGGDNHPLRGAKHSEWEGGVRVVSLVKWPEEIKGGSSTDELTSYIDIFPTIENIVAGKSQKNTDGTDVMPALKGGTLSAKYVFLGNTAVVSKKWKMNNGELFLIEEDMAEKNDVSDQYPEIMETLNKKIKMFHQMQPTSPPVMQTSNWTPPANWTMPGQH